VHPGETVALPCATVNMSMLNLDVSEFWSHCNCYSYQNFYFMPTVRVFILMWFKLLEMS
jgi:hypothetical protein